MPFVPPDPEPPLRLVTAAPPPVEVIELKTELLPGVPSIPAPPANPVPPAPTVTVIADPEATANPLAVL